MNIQTIFNEGRIIRNNWSGTDANGRELLCLYTALAGDKDARPANCPANLAPRWVAELLPWIDDAGTQEAWVGHVERVVALAPKLHKLGRKAFLRTLQVIVGNAQKHDTGESCRVVFALLGREIAGESVTPDEYRAAAARAAAWAARAAEAAEAAAWAAAWAAEAADEYRAAAAWAARAAAWAAEADQIITRILDVWTEELSAVE